MFGATIESILCVCIMYICMYVCVYMCVCVCVCIYIYKQPLLCSLNESMVVCLNLDWIQEQQLKEVWLSLNIHQCSSFYFKKLFP